VSRAEQTNKKLQLFTFVILVTNALKQDQAENGNFLMSGLYHLSSIYRPRLESICSNNLTFSLTALSINYLAASSTIDNSLSLLYIHQILACSSSAKLQLPDIVAVLWSQSSSTYQINSRVNHKNGPRKP
jgi:hypothetical protein